VTLTWAWNLRTIHSFLSFPLLFILFSMEKSHKLDVRHVMYDGYQGHCRDLEDLTDLHAAIEYIADSIGRELVNPPLLFPYFNGKTPEDKGISGMGVMQGGHVTVHSFSDRTRRCVFADLAFVEGSGTASNSGFRRTGRRPPLGSLLRDSMKEEFRTKEHETFTREKTPPTDTNEIDHSFGPHLTMEGVLKQDQRRLDWLYGFMEDLPPAIKMTPVTTPYLSRTTNWLDGVLLIAESHIALHVRRGDGRFYFDIFSCKSFEPEAILNQIRVGGLTFDEDTVRLTARGKKFPRPEAQ